MPICDASFNAFLLCLRLSTIWSAQTPLLPDGQPPWRKKKKTARPLVKARRRASESTCRTHNDPIAILQILTFQDSTISLVKERNGCECPRRLTGYSVTGARTERSQSVQEPRHGQGLHQRPHRRPRQQPGADWRLPPGRCAPEGRRNAPRGSRDSRNTWTWCSRMPPRARQRKRSRSREPGRWPRDGADSAALRSEVTMGVL
eukprot:COSAG04_NODE_214_length_20089_cov_206.678189_12_plen_203_part_00